MQQLELLPNANYEDSQYYSKDKDKYKYKYSSNNHAISNHNLNPLSTINNQAHSYHAKDNVCDKFSIQQIKSLPNVNYKESPHYLIDKDKYKYTSNDNNHATINPHHHNHHTLTTTNTHAHIYQAQDNVCNASNLPSTHYNATNFPTSTNTDPYSSCLHTTTRSPNTNNYQPSSTITVEQRRARKQHSIRWNEPVYSTAPPHTNHAGTQPRFSGILPTSTTTHTDSLSKPSTKTPS